MQALREVRRHLQLKARMLEKEIREMGVQRDMMASRWEEMESRNEAVGADNESLTSTLKALQQQAQDLEVQQLQHHTHHNNPDHINSHGHPLANGMPHGEPAGLHQHNAAPAYEHPAAAAGAAGAEWQAANLHPLFPGSGQGNPIGGWHHAAIATASAAAPPAAAAAAAGGLYAHLAHAAHLKPRAAADHGNRLRQGRQHRPHGGVEKKRSVGRVVVGPVGPALHNTRPPKQHQVLRAAGSSHAAPAGAGGAAAAAPAVAGVTTTHHPSTGRQAHSSRGGAHTFPPANLRRQHQQQRQVVLAGRQEDTVPAALLPSSHAQDGGWDPSILPDAPGSQVQGSPLPTTGGGPSAHHPAPGSGLLPPAPEPLPNGPDAMVHGDESVLDSLEGLENLLPEDMSDRW